MIRDLLILDFFAILLNPPLEKRMFDGIRLIAPHSTFNERCSQSLCQLLMIRLISRSHGHNHNVCVIIVYSLQLDQLLKLIA